MKKLLSITLVLCLLFSLSATLISCEHTCEFSEEWTKDATSHWHTCADPECAEIADKTEHVWDDGSITTKATQEAEGVKTYACTTCGQTKTEAVEFTGLSEEEWNAALADSIFENFTYTEEAKVNGDITAKSTYKFTTDEASVRVAQGTVAQEEFVTASAKIEALRKTFLDSLKELTLYENFEYDAETKTYKAIEPPYMTAVQLYANYLTVTFSEGYLSEIQYELLYSLNGVKYNVSSKITISDYGTTTITR